MSPHIGYVFRYRNVSNDDHQAKVDIEDVKSEVGTATEARTFVYTVGELVLFAPLDAEYTEGDVERDIVLYEYRYTGAEV